MLTESALTLDQRSFSKCLYLPIQRHKSIEGHRDSIITLYFSTILDDLYDESDYNEDESDYNEDESDYNEDESDYNEDESDYNEDESDYNEDESGYDDSHEGDRYQRERDQNAYDELDDYEGDLCNDDQYETAFGFDDDQEEEEDY